MIYYFDTNNDWVHKINYYKQKDSRDYLCHKNLKMPKQKKKRKKGRYFWFATLLKKKEYSGT